MAQVMHVRIVRRGYHFSSSGYLYKDGATANYNLCGAAPTEFDITKREAQTFKNDDRWQLCDACRAKATA